MSEFKVGDQVTIPQSSEKVFAVDAVGRDGSLFLWDETYSWYVTIDGKDAAAKCRHAKPADSEVLTEEWLRRVGLLKGMNGIKTCGDSRLKIRHDGTTIFLMTNKEEGDRLYGADLKTIGDARELTRLLGGKLEE